MGQSTSGSISSQFIKSNYFCKALIEALGVLALVGAIDVTALAADYASQDTVLTTPAGYNLASTYYWVTGKPGPALLLLSDINHSRNEWVDYLAVLKKAGIRSILAVDLRGNGNSNTRTVKVGDSLTTETVSWRQFDEQDLLDMVNDLATPWNCLKNASATDSARMAIMGAGVGANYAAVFAAGHMEVKSLAMLSPGVVLRAIECVSAVQEYGARPFLCVASKDDEYAVGSCRKLIEASAGKPAHMEIYETPGRGAELLRNNSMFRQFLSDWFRSTL